MKLKNGLRDFIKVLSFLVSYKVAGIVVVWYIQYLDWFDIGFMKVDSNQDDKLMDKGILNNYTCVEVNQNFRKKVYIKLSQYYEFDWYSWV